MISKYLVIFVVILANLSLTSCGNADIDGIVIKANSNHVLLATELSLAEYEEIKGLPASQIQNSDVLGDVYYGLIDLAYEDAASFTPGDQVEVWFDGEVMESYPLQATARRISLKKETLK